MIKMLLFVKKDIEENVLDHFRNFTLELLKDLGGEKFITGTVMSSLLLENKYNFYCELTANSKEEMDRLLSGETGKKLNKDLADFHNEIDIIFINLE